MTAPWPDLTATTSSRDLSGQAGFRLMPTDDVEPGPATARVETRAGGHALLVTYTWTHPTDGLQEGVLLAGSPDDEDALVRGTWLDAWHQQPAPMTLTGRLEDGTVELEGRYADTWGWQIDLTFTAEGLRIVMRNVVPQEALAQVPEGTGAMAGPYEVMDLRVS
ncbi:hypothetical protein ACQE98_07740 [Ornithinimicrobium sp. W1679]|uniref:hypothetical protein n=1 Tax=unclassified Ornithinimicrobium TaxID=2615080 RepID=UPI003CE6D08E